MEAGLTHWEDILVVVGYFCLVLAVGLWSLCRPNRGTTKGYFLAGRDMVWWPVGASLFASNIGSEHFIGLAGTGAASGIAIVMYEWMSMPLVIMLGWLFLPVYLTAGVYTLPEYLQKRFGGQRLRVYLSCLALILYVITKIAVCIYAGALFIQLSLGWDMYLSIVLLLAITGVYTVLGGLAAVIYTDTLQTAIMMIGASILCIISFVEIGGMEGLEKQYMKSIPAVNNTNPNSTCGYPRSDSFHLMRNLKDSDLPWIGTILQSSIGCLWYWCADQVIVQRALAARNLTHAKGGAILAGYLKILPLFIMIFPGMISRALYVDEVACVDPEKCLEVCGNEVGCSNIAYPMLVLRLMPIGLRGLMMAVMMSAIMSSLTSIFNSSSTIFTMDLWRRFRPTATERELLMVGRLFIVFLCGVSIAWVPLVKSSAGGQLFVYIQAIQGYLGTAIGALFFMAVFWKRMNEKGAFFGILAGHTCGIIRMVLDFVYPAPECGQPDTRPAVVANMHYSYFGTLAIVITIIVIVVVSLITEPSKDKQLKGLTWWTRKDFEENNLEMASDKLTLKEEVPEVDRGHIDEKNSEIEAGDRSFWKRWRDLVLGKSDIGSTSQPDNVTCTLDEHPTWRKVVNVNAIVALFVLTFLFGFYR